MPVNGELFVVRWHRTANEMIIPGSCSAEEGSHEGLPLQDIILARILLPKDRALMELSLLY